MPAEQMGKLSEKLRLTFAVATVVCVLALAISPLKIFAPNGNTTSARS